MSQCLGGRVSSAAYPVAYVVDGAVICLRQSEVKRFPDENWRRLSLPLCFLVHPGPELTRYPCLDFRRDFSGLGQRGTASTESTVHLLHAPVDVVLVDQVALRVSGDAGLTPWTKSGGGRPGGRALTTAVRCSAIRTSSLGQGRHRGNPTPSRADIVLRPLRYVCGCAGQVHRAAAGAGQQVRPPPDRR